MIFFLLIKLSNHLFYFDFFSLKIYFSQTMHHFCIFFTRYISSRLIAEIRKITANILSNEYDFLTLVI